MVGIAQKGELLQLLHLVLSVVELLQARLFQDLLFLLSLRLHLQSRQRVVVGNFAGDS